MTRATEFFDLPLRAGATSPSGSTSQLKKICISYISPEVKKNQRFSIRSQRFFSNDTIHSRSPSFIQYVRDIDLVVYIVLFYTYHAVCDIEPGLYCDDCIAIVIISTFTAVIVREN